MEATVGPDDENTTTEFQLDATKLAHPWTFAISTPYGLRKTRSVLS